MFRSRPSCHRQNPGGGHGCSTAPTYGDRLMLRLAGTVFGAIA